jgi:hypothetical protein
MLFAGLGVDTRDDAPQSLAGGLGKSEGDPTALGTAGRPPFLW